VKGPLVQSLTGAISPPARVSRAVIGREQSGRARRGRGLIEFHAILALPAG
jgi:hypothetical protein